MVFLTKRPAKKYIIFLSQTHHLSLSKVSLFVIVSFFSFFPTEDKFLPYCWSREPQISLDIHTPDPAISEKTEFIFSNVEYLEKF